MTLQGIHELGEGFRLRHGLLPQGFQVFVHRGVDTSLITGGQQVQQCPAQHGRHQHACGHIV